MRACSKCGRQKPPLRRGLCGACYESARARVGFESTLVDAEPARQHVKELVDAGLSKRQICRLADIRRQEMADLTNGRPHRGTGPCRQILRDKADRILAIEIPGAVHRIASPGQFVPIIGTVRRMQALVAIGYTQAWLCEQIGVAPSNGRYYFKPGLHSCITAAKARQIEQLFAQLQCTPGPSDRARRFAAKRGWLPPFAWDEETIDDPADKPHLESGERLGFVDRYNELRELGYNDHHIAAKLDIRLSSLERSLDRAGLPVSDALRQAVREERGSDAA